MKFASLGSGSRGNASLIRCGDTLLLLDCGFTLKETVARCSRLGVDPAQLTAVLVTHEHSDHCLGVGAVARKFGLPTYMTPGTHLNKDFGKLPDLQLIVGHAPFVIGSIEITPVPVPHDAKEPAQFVFRSEGMKLGVLTDLGCYTPYVCSHFSNCDVLVLEFNHDLEMLHLGPYPPSLKRRVAGSLGHLNNQQASQLLGAIVGDNTRHIIASHLSEKNNTVALAAYALEQGLEAVTDRDRLAVHFASQKEGLHWLTFE